MASGTYEVIVTDAKGCQEAAFVNINKENISLNISSVNVSCSGELGTATVDTVFGGQAPFSYNWSNNNTTKSITGLSVGTYSVTVTDDRGCVATGSTVITQDQLFNVNIVASNTLCSQNTGRVIAIPQSGGVPFSFLWSDGSTGSFLENLGAGTYSVTITDNNQCVGTATAQLIEENNLAVTASSVNASCGVAANGTATITPTAGTAPFAYRWENRSDTTASITNLSPGTYRATVTDANGCQRVADVNVGEENDITNRFEIQVNADNETVNVTTITAGGLQNYTYLGVIK
ncbi:MAG: hypothetical protein HC892_17625 [Saprospiraceae bacterium]|nr:hypothetical protein [Saprospiraceae bacterium]